MEENPNYITPSMQDRRNQEFLTFPKKQKKLSMLSFLLCYYFYNLKIGLNMLLTYHMIPNRYGEWCIIIWMKITMTSCLFPSVNIAAFEIFFENDFEDISTI